MRYSADKSVTVRLIVIYTWLTNTCVLYIIGNKRSYSVILILIPGTHSAICWAFYQLLLYCSGRQSAGCSVHADPAHERSSGQPGPRLRLQGRGAQVPGSGINHSGFTKPHTGILSILPTCSISLSFSVPLPSPPSFFYFYLSFFLFSFFVCRYLPGCLSASCCLYMSIYRNISGCLYVSVNLNISGCLYVSVNLNISGCLFVRKQS